MLITNLSSLTAYQYTVGEFSLKFPGGDKQFFYNVLAGSSSNLPSGVSGSDVGSRSAQGIVLMVLLM